MPGFAHRTSRSLLPSCGAERSVPARASPASTLGISVAFGFGQEADVAIIAFAEAVPQRGSPTCSNHTFLRGELHLTASPSYSSPPTPINLFDDVYCLSAASNRNVSDAGYRVRFLVGAGAGCRKSAPKQWYRKHMSAWAKTGPSKPSRVSNFCFCSPCNPSRHCISKNESIIQRRWFDVIGPAASNFSGQMPTLLTAGVSGSS